MSNAQVLDAMACNKAVSNQPPSAKQTCFDPPPIDVVMLVAGTTDPLNIKGVKHQANSTYWRDTKDNFWAKVKDLKPQYLDLHIEDSFFSWSGDNNTEERTKAADRLLNLLERVYRGWKNKEVHLHLIGHSHGGNVINQFTQLISTDKRFPKQWKVKSITYLSTPFFTKKHQLNKAKLHPDCTLINVRNDYDLTQKVIAGFSLVNLESFLKDLSKDDFSAAIEKIKTINTAEFNKLKKWKFTREDGQAVWRTAGQLMGGISDLMGEISKYLVGIKVGPEISQNVTGLVRIFNNAKSWAADSQEILSRHSNNTEFNRLNIVDDLLLVRGLTVLNTILQVGENVKSSFLLNTLAKIFFENNGITETREVTYTSPIKQASGLKIIDINITKKDCFHTFSSKAALFEDFAKGLQKNLADGNLQEFLMRVISQLLSPNLMLKVDQTLDNIEYIVTGDLDTQVKALRFNIENYRSLANSYYRNMDTEKEINGMPHRPGTVPYFATTAHGLSHTKFWPEVENGMRTAFSSGINKGFRK